MLIKDRIYGNFQISEPVILELLKSKPLLRLREISQLGVPDKYNYVRGFSRYEHSVGVMLVLKMLDASLEEQVAGLLHDVSHTAFSHIIDWVLGQGKTENFQDNRHIDFITKSEIASILARYGYNPKNISDLQSFKLLDREIPDLCADRIDYALRQLPPSTVKKTLGGLTTLNGKIMFRSKDLALAFAESFLQLEINDWSGFEGASRYQLFADVLKRAIALKMIKIEDFFGDEEMILKRVESGGDKAIKRDLSLLRRKSLSGLPLSKERVYRKFRYIDPEYVGRNKLQRVSKTVPKFAKKIKEAREENEKGILVVLGG